MESIKNGLYQDFYPNGQKKSEVMYVNGVKHGVFTQWLENGKKYDEKRYINGLTFIPAEPYKYVIKTPLTHAPEVPQYTTQPIQNGLLFYPNGKKRCEFSIINGKLEGLYTDWYDSGQKAIETIYVNDKREGMYTQWYESGQKFFELTYTNGKEDGYYRKWYENGELWKSYGV